MEDGLTLAVGGTAVGAVCTLLGSFIKARFGKTTVEPQPLPVKIDERYASKESNNEAHREIFLRLAAVEQSVAAIRAENSATRESLKEIRDDMREIKAPLLNFIQNAKLP